MSLATSVRLLLFPCPVDEQVTAPTIPVHVMFGLGLVVMLKSAIPATAPALTVNELLVAFASVGLPAAAAA